MSKMTALRKSKQLFISWANSHRGKPISRQRLSHWVIILCYNSLALELPEGVRAHSTRDMAISWALFKYTFVQFYRMDVMELSLAHSVLSVFLKNKQKIQHPHMMVFPSYVSLFILGGIDWDLSVYIHLYASLILLAGLLRTAYLQYRSRLYPIVRYLTNV